MSLTVREEGSVPLPEDLAQEFGIHKGSEIEWERTDDGALKLRTAKSRLAAFDLFSETLRATLKPGEDGMEWFLKWRQEERELDYSYQHWRPLPEALPDKA